LLTAVLDKLLTDDQVPLAAFTQDYRDDGCSERFWVQEIAARTGRDVHFSYMSADDFVKIHDTLNWYQGEPYAGVPVAGYVGMYQQARAHNVTVLLDGNGVDEALGGYRQYHNTCLSMLQASEDPQFGDFLDAYMREWGVSRDQAMKSVARSQRRIGVARDGSSEGNAGWLSDEFCRRSTAPTFKRPFSSPLKNAMYQDVRFTKIPRALRFNDHVSMAFSRELRVPFLNPRLFEMAFSLPAKTLFHTGRPKGLLRQQLAGMLPDSVRLAPKRHIQTPQSSWLTNDLMPWLRDIVSSQHFRESGYFDQKRALKALDSLAGKPLANSFFLWQAINLDTWLQSWVHADGSRHTPAPFPQISAETVHGSQMP
jgi:asparagine synthase (glutamine-hydrolysing)